MRSEQTGRWDDGLYFKFIRLYEENKCLWKTDSSSYKCRAARDAAIQRVIDGMGLRDFRIMDYKNKVKNIRSHYCQELKKIYDSKRLSATGEATYEPKLAWFAPLDRFLRPYVQASSQKTEESDSSSHYVIKSLDETAGEEDEEYELEDEWTNVSIERLKEPIVNGDVPTEQRVFCEALDEEERPAKKRRNSEVPSIPNASLVPDFPNPAAGIVDANSASKSAELNEREFEAFGRSIAAQLNNMNFPDALEMQLKIQALITDERLKRLRNPHNPLF